MAVTGTLKTNKLVLQTHGALDNNDFSLYVEDNSLKVGAGGQVLMSVGEENVQDINGSSSSTNTTLTLTKDTTIDGKLTVNKDIINSNINISEELQLISQRLATNVGNKISINAGIQNNISGTALKTNLSDVLNNAFVNVNMSQVTTTYNTITNSLGHVSSNVFQVPPNYNGCVFMYSHGFVSGYNLSIPPDSPVDWLDDASPLNGPVDPYVYISTKVVKYRTNKYLLDMGYALIGSQFAFQGYNVQSAIATNLAMLNDFKTKYPTTNKVIVWGNSQGSTISRCFAETYPNLVDAVGLHDHLFDLQTQLSESLNITWFLKNTFNSNLTYFDYDRANPVTRNVQVGLDLGGTLEILGSLSANSWSSYPNRGALGTQFKTASDTLDGQAYIAGGAAVSAGATTITTPSGNPTSNAAYISSIFTSGAAVSTSNANLPLYITTAAQAASAASVQAAAAATQAALIAAAGAGENQDVLAAVVPYITAVSAAAAAGGANGTLNTAAADAGNTLGGALVAANAAANAASIGDFGTAIGNSVAANVAAALAKPAPVLGAVASLFVPLKSDHYGSTSSLPVTLAALAENVGAGATVAINIGADIETLVGGTFFNNSNFNFSSKRNTTFSLLIGGADANILSTVDTYKNDTKWVAGPCNIKLYDSSFIARSTGVITKPTVTIQAQYDNVVLYGNAYDYQVVYNSNLGVGLGNSNMLLNLVNVPTRSEWVLDSTANAMSGTSHANFSDNNYSLVASLLINAAYKGSNLSLTNEALLKNTVNSCDPVSSPLVYASNIGVLESYNTGYPNFQANNNISVV